MIEILYIYMPNFNKNLFFAVFIAIITLTHSAKVQCQYEQSSWQPGKRYSLSEREELVSTLYNFDLIVDKMDGTVSQIIRNSGTWEPSNIRTMARFVKQGSTIINIGSHVGL